MNSSIANEGPGEETLIERARLEMLKRLASSTVFVRNQQRNEEPLTDQERFEILSDILSAKPGLFIERYHGDLIQEDLLVFDKLKERNTLVSYYFDQLCKKFNKQTITLPKVNVVTKKNRRYIALQRLIKEGDYFSEEEMKSRAPRLYEELIGQYLTDNEACEKSQQLNSVQNLSTLLLKQMDYQRERQERDAYESEEESEKEDNASVCSDESELNDEPERKSKKIISLEEKLQLREEFYKRMQESFLSGNDKNVDYLKIDNDAANDCMNQLEMDEQDKYFDDETPETVNNY
ncbi:DgyrCDS9936 [Dimorphilus gyrociliatus]|uniref:DgyrCDS9936 n=1 Tax=Dimorphilus gyrociliatus TaxID=2664684 RepID=A0A7I8VYK9_9ANNE|nr:DgyrCDS9936 [Dimorphilus gyrociliatus]